MSYKILKCGANEDYRFNDIYAKVSVNNKVDTIKNHYNNAKVFKNNKLIAFNICGYKLPLRFGAMFYDLLWYKYLKTNKELENILLTYDNYDNEDKTKEILESNVIRRYMNDDNNIKYEKNKLGYNLYCNCLELINILNKKNTIVIENGDIFKGCTDIIGHQVNAKGVMGSGIARIIKADYPAAFYEYRNHPYIGKECIMGEAQIVKTNDRIIANLFGQFDYGRNPNRIYTNKYKLEEALAKLKEYAKANNLSVGIPYNIGCGLGNEKWENIFKIIKDVFSDYYIIIYKI